MRFYALEFRLLVEPGVFRIESADAVEIAVRAVSPRVHPPRGHPLVAVDALPPGELALNRVRRGIEVDRVPVLLDGDRLPQVAEIALAGMVGVVLVPELVEVRLCRNDAGARARGGDQARRNAHQCPFISGLHRRTLHHSGSCASWGERIGAQRPESASCRIALRRSNRQEAKPPNARRVQVHKTAAGAAMDVSHRRAGIRPTGDLGRKLRRQPYRIRRPGVRFCGRGCCGRKVANPAACRRRPARCRRCRSSHCS